ncbi:MAG: hypothetical protein ABIP19_01990 [Dermatophilaceae bacterium]
MSWAARGEVLVHTRLAHEGAHRPAAALAAAQLPDVCLARLRDLHHELAAPFLRALKELGPPDPQLTAQLLRGVLDAAMRAIESGASLAAVTDRTLTLVRSAVGSVAADLP